MFTLIENKDIFTRKSDTAWSQLIEAQANRDSKVSLIVFDISLVENSILKNFENEVKNTQNLNVDFYFLDLIKYREISNKIAEDFESPQLIVFENGRPLNNASHQDISLSQIIK